MIKRFLQFVNESAPVRIDIAHTSPHAARSYFDNSLVNMGINIEAHFPDFDDNYRVVRHKISFGKYDRNEMPVIKSDDLEKFITFMNINNGVQIKKTKETAAHLIPIQKQLYLDHPITSIKEHGLKNAIDFVKNKSHSIISRDNYVMDGNHRWLLAMLHDPKMMVNVSRVDMNMEDLFHEMNHFTDKVTRRQRNESFTPILNERAEFPYSVQQLKTLYSTFNQKYFDGELLSIDILIKTTRKYFAIARGEVIRSRFTRIEFMKPTVIEFSSLFVLSEPQLYGIMTHEMVHIWCFQNQHDDGHGHIFMKKLNEIQAKTPFFVPLSEDIKPEDIEYSDKLKKTSYVLLLTDPRNKEYIIKVSKKLAQNSNEIEDTVIRLMNRGSIKHAQFGTTESPNTSKIPEVRTLKTIAMYDLASVGKENVMSSFKKEKRWSGGI